VITLGVLAVIVLAALPGTTTSTTIATTGSTTTTAPRTAGDAARVAARSACQASYAELATAVADYRALNGVAPAAGTAWATSSAHGGPFLQSWPARSTYYAITWNGTVLVVTPTHGAPARGSAGTAAPETGCFAA